MSDPTTWPVEVDPGQHTVGNWLVGGGTVIGALATAPLLWLALGAPADFTWPLVWAAVAFVLGCVGAYLAVEARLRRLSAAEPPVRLEDGALLVPRRGQAPLRFPVDAGTRATVHWYDGYKVKGRTTSMQAVGQRLYLHLARDGESALISCGHGYADAEERGLPFGGMPPGQHHRVEMAPEHILGLWDRIAPHVTVPVRGPAGAPVRRI